jgi:NitT/TauT family transport system permease protein
MLKNNSFILAHLLLIALLVTIFLPGKNNVASPTAFLGAIIIIELFFLWRMLLRKGKNRRNADLMILIWLLFLVWEIVVSKLNLAHPVLVPAPENIFAVFTTQYPFLIKSVFSSLELLLIGTVGGIGLGLIFGLAVGWVPRLRGIFYPIAQVLAPIPPIVYAPYLIALMPTFRSASALVIFLGIFWPTFLNMIIRVSAIEPRILNSARALDLNNFTMIKDILLPYTLPGVVSGLKVTLTTSIMLLIFAEMMGATSGMGYYIINYTHYANYTNVVAGIILVGIVVMALNWLVGKIQKHAIKWR